MTAHSPAKRKPLTRRLKENLTSGQVAELIGVAGRTVNNWFDKGVIGGYRIPGSEDRRFPVAEVIAFCQREGVPVPPALLAGGRLVACLTGPLPGVEVVSAVAMGVLAGDRTLGKAVVGCRDGFDAAVEVGRVVARACPGARLCLLRADDVAADRVPTLFGAAVPAGDVDALVAWLVAG